MNFLTNEEVTSGNRNVVLPNDTKITMDEACEKQESFTKNRRREDKIFGTHTDERGFGEFGTHMTY